MSHLSRKFVAVLMLLWLPLFSGSALAVSVSMQEPQGSCHQAVVQPDDMSTHHHDAAPEQVSPDEHAASSCDSCGICHLACSGYLAVADVASPDMPQALAAMTPYLVSFHSVISTPLLPPPLVRV